MNIDTCLKIQSWIDGELPADEAVEVGRLVAADPEAGAWARSLRALKTGIRGNELSRPVPVGREQYWGGIATALDDPLEATIKPDRKHRPWWLTVLAPLGAATAAVVALVLVGFPDPVPPQAPQAYAEIVDPLDDVSSFTFRSESEQMTVVWVDTR
jgi:anti-sigma factor RsiW